MDTEVRRLLDEYDKLAEDSPGSEELDRKLKAMHGKVPENEWERRYDAREWALTYLD